MISLQGKYEVADLKAAQDLHAKPGPAGMIFLFVVLALITFLLVSGIVLTLIGAASWQVFLLPLLILGFLALFWFVLRPSQIARAYRQHKELASEFQMDLTDEGYSIQNDYGSGKIPWKDFHKWKADKNIILLYRTDAMFNMVPTRLLHDDSQARYILDQLQKNGVREASKVKNPVRSVTQWVMYGILALAILLLIYLNLR